MHIYLRHKTAPALGIAALLMLSVPLNATAAPVPAAQSASAIEALNPASDAPTLSAEESFTQAASHLARIENISQEKAEAALHAGIELGTAAGDLRKLIGEREVSMVLEYTPLTRLVVKISGAARIRGVDELVSSAKHAITIEYVGRPGIEELDQALRAATIGWKRAFPQVQRTTVNDDNSNEILVVVATGSSPVGEETLRELAPSIPRSIKLSIIEELEGDGGRDFSRGGLPLNIQGDPSAAHCTSGFMATKNTSGTKVFTTAAHCGNSLMYKGVA